MDGTDGHFRIRNQATGRYLAAVEMSPKLDGRLLENGILEYGRRLVFTEIDTREFSPVAHSLDSSLGEEHSWEVYDKDGFFQLMNIRLVLITLSTVEAA